MSEQLWFMVLSVSLFINVTIIQGSRHFQNLEGIDIETIFATENENVKIECKTDIPMAYCGFVDPSGRRYSELPFFFQVGRRAYGPPVRKWLPSLMDLDNTRGIAKLLGPTLNAGHCFKNINVTKEDDGQWRCHIGGHEKGVEITKIIQLHVVKDVTAVRKNISATHAKSITIACITTRRLIPLSYCRFEPPEGKPFNIAEDVTIKNSILGRYYFPKNMSLDRGDCTVTIYSVQYEDNGKWTCGAGLEDGNEHVDTIYIDVDGIYTMSTASAIGITLGCMGTIGLIGYFAWTKRQFLGTTPRQAPGPAESHELEPLEPQSSRTRSGIAIPQVTVEPPSETSSSPTP